MRRLNKIIFIIFVCFFSSCICVDASTKTFTRTEDNLLVPGDITVTADNKSAILNTPAVDASEKIYDFGEILTTEEEKKLFKKVKEYSNISGIDLVILTAKTGGTDVREPMTYMYDFYDYNAFRTNGVIFFVYQGEKEIEIYMGTTGAVSEIYTESRISQTLEYVHPYLVEKKYYTAFETYIKIIQGFYNLEYEDGKINSEGDVVKNGVPLIEILVFSIATSFVVVMLLINHCRNKGIKTNIDKLNKNTIVIKLQNEVVVNTDLNQNEKKN